MRIRTVSADSGNAIKNSAENTTVNAPISSGPDAVLTVAEVACELRCSKTHVYNIIRNRVPGVKPLPAITLGRKKLIRRRSFERWKQLNEVNVVDATLPATSEVNTVDA